MSRFTRNRIKARRQRAEQYRRSGHFYDMPVKKLERLREYEPDETMQKTCSECKHFEQKKMTGFFYQGGGDTPVEEDIKNVMALTEKLTSDNMSE